MFVGHFAAGIAGKIACPRLPLWPLIGASQLLDLGWATLVMAGVEKLRIVPGLPGSPLDLYYMPWTHSLPTALLWSGVAGLLAARWWQGVPRAGIVVALVVFSHWLLDLVVHRPDLGLWFDSMKVGLGLWNLPQPEMALEMGMVALAGGGWIALRKDQGLAAAPALGFLLLLTVLQMVSLVSGATENGVQMGLLALFGYGVTMAGAWWAERRDKAAIRR